jgi:hypothetical protein
MTVVGIVVMALMLGVVTMAAPGAAKAPAVAVRYRRGKRGIVAGLAYELMLADAARIGDEAGRAAPDPLDAARVTATRLYHRVVALTPTRRVTTWRVEQLLVALGGPVLVRRPLCGSELETLAEVAVLVRTLRRLAERNAEAYAVASRMLADVLPGLLPTRALQQISVGRELEI